MGRGCREAGAINPATFSQKKTLTMMMCQVADVAWLHVQENQVVGCLYLDTEDLSLVQFQFS